MSIQTNSPSTNLGTSVSADGISAAIWCGTAGGTANAITLTIPGSPTVVAGMLISWRAAAANSGSVTINTGSGAKPLYKQVDPIYGISNLQSGAIQNRSQNFAQWSEYHEAWMLLSPVPLSAADIPSTLGTTNFGAGGVVVGWGNQVYKDSTTSNLSLLGGNQGTEARVLLHGNSHATKPGDAEYYTGTASGAAHSFFDKNGVEELKVDEIGVNANYITTLSGTTVTVTANSNGGLLTLRSSNVENESSQLKLHSAYHSTYPGAHQQFAPLSTRAASTAFAVCPVATGDAAVIEVFSGGGTGIQVLVHVDVAGTVTLQNPADGVTYNSAYQVTSSPTASQVGIYWSAGIVYIKPGSDFTGGSAIKIATFSKIAKA